MKVYAIDVEEGQVFTFQPVRGNPRTEKYVVVRHDNDHVIVKAVGSDREEKFNQYAYVTPGG